MTENRISRQELFNQLPPERPVPLLAEIQRRVKESGRKVIVLDDDPTGTQTVHDVPVLTDWLVESLAEEISGSAPAVYLLTNSRSLPLPEAQALNEATGARLRQAAAQLDGGHEIGVISRSDSTLRGHFPGEVAALARGLGTDFDAWLVVPFFPEGGRFTIGDIHYVAEGDWLTPAGATEFARDKAFGYRASNLKEWVAEKTGGAIPARQVASISIEDLRLGGPETVAQRLLALPKGSVCIANAASDGDLEVLVLGLLAAEAQGKRFLYRTAASFVRVRAGISARSLLTRVDLDLPAQGAGLVIAGSYVPRTSSQLENLFDQTDIEPVEVRVPRLLDEATRADEIEHARQAVDRKMQQGQDAALFTSRGLVSATGSEANLALGRVISDSLVTIARGLTVRPRYLLAKGGITSSDIATRGLGIRRAMVIGQILPGVPVWRTGPESRYPGMAYIVFPGNVGGPDAMTKIVMGLKA